MTKIRTLKGQKLTPKVLLHQILDQADELRNVVVITQSAEGTQVYYNDMDDVAQLFLMVAQLQAICFMKLLGMEGDE